MAAEQPAHYDTDTPWNEPGAEPYIRIEHVTKKFGDFVAVNDVSLNIYRGELFSLLGGSGCGKTTLLRMLAGFEEPTSGSSAWACSGRGPASWAARPQPTSPGATSATSTATCSSAARRPASRATC